MAYNQIKCRFVESQMRKPMLVSHGLVLAGAAMPHPDVDHAQSAAVGAAARFAIEPPKCSQTLRHKLRTFVAGWLRRNLTPLAESEVMTYDEWSESTSYPKWRREELRRVYERTTTLGVKEVRNKSFIKREVYPDWKHLRAINARCDEVKVVTGRLFKSIERVLFRLPWFIKKIPAADRPRYIYERLKRTGRVKYVATDYTAFEGLFTSDLMKDVEFQLYEYMLDGLKDMPFFREFMAKVLAGVNECVFRQFVLYIVGKRMSGEMNTSLGNSFSNLMFFLFVCDHCGVSEQEVPGVVEGDDGLFALSRDIDVGLFGQLGLVIKIDEHDDLCTASFCGMIFDEEELSNVTDPREVLASFGWFDPRYAKASDSKRDALVRCRAISLAYAYPGCPIISVLAAVALQMTVHVTRRDCYKVAMTMDDWNREWHIKALDQLDVPSREIGRRTRLLVETKYGVTVEQQLRVEQRLREMTGYGLLRLPELESGLPLSWKLYWDNYVHVNVGPMALDVKLPGSRSSVQFGLDKAMDHPLFTGEIGSKMKRTLSRPLSF